MGCPVCPTAGWIGGWIGGYFGIHPPSQAGGRIFSAVITANLISMTVIALKALFNLSLCVGGTFHLKNIIRIASQTLLLGIVYSIGVNYLLNHYVFSSSNPSPNQQPHPQYPSCCQHQQTDH